MQSVHLGRRRPLAKRDVLQIATLLSDPKLFWDAMQHQVPQLERPPLTRIVAALRWKWKVLSESHKQIIMPVSRQRTNVLALYVAETGGGGGAHSM